MITETPARFSDIVAHPYCAVCAGDEYHAVITRASLRLAKIRKLHAKSAYGDRVVIGRSEHA